MLTAVSRGNTIKYWKREGRELKECEDRDFYPYFYVKENMREYLQVMMEEYNTSEEKVFREIKETHMKTIKGKKLIKVILTNPKYVVRIRNMFKETYESDVLYTNRWALDTKVSQEKEDYRKCYIDIETESGNNAPTKFPDYENALNKVLTVCIYDNYTEEYHHFYFNNGDIPKEVKEHKYQCEKDMLQGVMNFIQERDFDIYTAWNVLFDMRYLSSRIRKVGLSTKQLTRTKQEFKIDGDRIQAEGRVCFDLLKGCKMTTPHERESYSLQNVAIEELGEGKQEHDGLQKLYEENPTLFNSYNIKDVELIVRLDKKMHIIEHFDAKRKIVHGYFEDSIVTNKINDLTFIKGFNEEGYALRKIEKYEGDVSYDGAYVINECGGGMYENVSVIDYERLYPSSIITCNISPETICKDGEIKVGKYRFTNKKKGVVPKIIQTYIDLRNQYKKQRDQYEVGTQEYKVYDNLQFVTKTIVNSIYGALAYRNSRVFDVRCAEATTWMGRYMLMYAIRIAKRKGFRLLISDTDSCFLTKEGLYLIEEMIKQTNQLIGDINKGFKELFECIGVKEYTMKMDFEKIYKRMFIGKMKKRYVGMIIWKDGKMLQEPILSVTGYESKRSDTPKAIREAQKQMFNIMLSDNLERKKETIEYLVGIKKDIIDTFTERREMEKYCLPIGIQKSLDMYGKSTPIHVRASMIANKYNGETIGMGDKVKYCYTTPENIARTDVIAFNTGFPRGYKPDIKKMLERLFVTKLENIILDIGWKLPNDEAEQISKFTEEKEIKTKRNSFMMEYSD